MWPRLALAAVILAALPAPAQQAPSEARNLARSLPDAVPDVSSWERSSGHAEFDGPRRTFDYELYVDPRRDATYAVTRYRITVFDAAERERAGLTPTEKLQWDVDGRLMRRFECRPEQPGAAGCRWVELAADSEEYRQQLKPILAVYAVHRQLLFDREKQR